MPITQLNTNQYISVTTTFGDVKYGFQASDHSGWIKLDGRLKSTLTATQQANATTLGFGTNLPNADDKYLSQVSSGALGDLSGNSSNQVTLSQNQLPNVTLDGSTNTTGSHTHTIDAGTGNILYQNISAPFGISGWTAGSIFNSPNGIGGNSTLDNSGDHNHTITTNSINGGVTQVATNIKPHTMKVNCFVYLGTN